jgi:hypothetical protein
MILKLIRKSRRYAYNYARIAGDVQAVLTGRIINRIVQRELGKRSRRTLNKLRIK